MKICVTSQGDNLDAQVEERFGRSPYFIIYDTDSSNFEAVKNPNISAPSGAGIQSAQLIVDKNIEVILTGNQLGPKASQVVETTKIKVVTGISGIVREVIEQYQSSSVTALNAAVRESTPNNWFGRCVRRWFGRGNGGNYGQGLGRGFDQVRGDQGTGRGQGGGFGGTPNQCLCPKCGEKVEHQRGVPCVTSTCPKCGTTMVRG